MEREDIERLEAAFKSEYGPSPKAPPPGDDDQSKAMKIEVNTSEEMMRMGGGQTEKVRNIMTHVIARSSHASYATKNIPFVLWLLHSNEFRALLEPWFLDIVQGLDDVETRRKTKEILVDMQADADNCPVILSALTFEVFSHYLTTRRPQRAGVVVLSFASFSAHRSALMNLYHITKYEMPACFSKLLSQFMSGMKRKIQHTKLLRGDQSREGKRRMVWDVYELTCKLMQEGKVDDFVFEHCFLTLEWNLIARSENLISRQ